MSVIGQILLSLSASRPGKATSASKGMIMPEATLLPGAPASRSAAELAQTARQLRLG